MIDRLIKMTRNPASEVSAQDNGLSEGAAYADRWSCQALNPPISAVLFHKGEQTGCGRILGFGPYGVRLETKAVVGENEYLHVQFTLVENGQDVPYRLFGRVVSHSANKIGLLMDVLAPDTRDGFQALLAIEQTTPEPVAA